VKLPLSAQAAAREETLLAQRKDGKGVAKPLDRAAPRSIPVLKRKADLGGPPAGAKKGRGASGAAVCKVSPRVRLQGFEAKGHVYQLTEEGFTVDANDASFLFCGLCAKRVNVKSDRILAHLGSAEHAAHKERRGRQEARFVFINEALNKAQELGAVASGASEGVTRGVSKETVTFRVKTVVSLLSAGVALSKLDRLRPHYEEYGRLSLTNSKHMQRHIPVVRAGIVDETRAWIAGQRCQVVLDGASVDGEMFGVGVSIVDRETYTRQTRCVALRMYDSSFNGIQLAREINRIILSDMSVNPDDVISIVHDRAAYNYTATTALRPFLRHAVVIGCLAHTAHNLGDKMSYSSLSQLEQGLSYMWTMSRKAKSAWQQRTGWYPPTASANRWWSKWEVQRYICENWGDLLSYLDSLKAQDFCEATVKKLLQLLNGWKEIIAAKPAANGKPAVPAREVVHKGMAHSVMVELAAVVGYGQRWVDATKEWEGDSLVALFAYDRLRELEIANEVLVFPLVEAVARSFVQELVKSTGQAALCR